MGSKRPQEGTSADTGSESTPGSNEPDALTDEGREGQDDDTRNLTSGESVETADTGDTVETADGDDGAPDSTREANGAAMRSMTGWQRLQESFYKPQAPRSPKRQPPAAVDFSKMSGAEVRARINQIDDTERKIGLAGAILATIFALIFTIPYMVSKIAVATTVKPLHKTCAGHLTYEANGKGPATCNGVYPASHYVFPLVVWLVFALAIYVTVRIGRRAPVAFALVLTGLAFGTFIVIVPFVAAGGWLLVRAWRTQKYGSPTARAPLEGYVRPGPREPRGSRAAPRSPTAKTAPGGAGGSASERPAGARLFRRSPTQAPQKSTRSVPAPNKRYTPKAPPRKKAPPVD